MRQRVPILLFVAALLAAPALAQHPATVHGTVTDPAGEPLPGAHVYLAGTMQGTVAGSDGRYRLPVPLGAHRLAASMVGYTVAAEEVVVRQPGEVEVHLTLAPSVYDLGSVEVVARNDRRWRRQLARFERTLIGQSSFADSVRLLNPEVLEFSGRLGRLQATARAPLEIENRALGYLLRYDLEVFDAQHHLVRYHGEPFFEELEPASGEEAARWAAARATAYRGSLPHFLRSATAGTLSEEGFLLVHRPDESLTAHMQPRLPPGMAPRWRVIEPRAVLQPDPDSGGHRLAFRGMIEINYAGQPEDPGFATWEWNFDRRGMLRDHQVSQISVERGGAVFDDRGELADPFSLTRSGYLAFRRLAMMLPVEYGLDPPPTP